MFDLLQVDKAGIGGYGGGGIRGRENSRVYRTPLPPYPVIPALSPWSISNIALSRIETYSFMLLSYIFIFHKKICLGEQAICQQLDNLKARR